MKKILAILPLIALMACESNDVGVWQNGQYSGSNVRQEYEVIAPENVVVQPDEEIQTLQTIAPVKSTAPSAAYMDWLARKLRRKLRSTGVQVKDGSGEINLIIPNKVAFGNNQWEIQGKFEESMTAIANLLKEYDETMIQIIGYTDNSSGVLQNKEASLKKANSISTFLQQNGIEPRRIITDGAGADNPIGNNETTTGRELNRRVEINIISLK